MKIKDIIDTLEQLAPQKTAESFDNTGLLVGDKNSICSGILVVHDSLESVVDEAIELGANLIVSFHPIIFSGLKSLTGKNYVEKAVVKAIKNDVAIYALHTALDNSDKGVSFAMSEALGLKNPKVLIPKDDFLYNLIVFSPTSHTEQIKKALSEAGAGKIGDYDSCNFVCKGEGNFRALENAKPFVGRVGEIHNEVEDMISVVFKKHLLNKIIDAVLKKHPYQTPAYQITKLENKSPDLGMGIIAELETPIDQMSFLYHLKEVFKADGIRYSNLLGKPIKKVAMLGGSGVFALEAAKAQGADIFISADFKYHDFYLAENKILIADIGHYESESFTKNIISYFLSKKFTNFAVNISKINTNPINYLK